MSAKGSKRHRLLRRLADLLESSALLREQLALYERETKKIIRRIESGERAVIAGVGTDVASHRRQVTESVQQFEAARHRLRLAFMALARKEGDSISEVARVLGVSRQLASRLAGEADGDVGEEP